MQTAKAADCVVVGTGAVGLATALALARAGFDTVAIGPGASARVGRDLRTTALFSGSVAFLRHLGAWDDLEPVAAPLTGLRLVDDTGGILRAPETLFRAEELGLAAFGYNIANAHLLQVLEEHARRTANLHLVHTEVAALSATRDVVLVTLSGGHQIRSRLAVGADGRKSITRVSAGIRLQEWTYPQSAIVATFGHSGPHDGISTEFHRRVGPLTTVPLQGQASSLVWVEHPAEAQRLMQLAAEPFMRELETRLHGILGGASELGARAAFALSGASAQRLTGHRVALVGEAAHVLPPIGAQGLNLGLRDAATLTDLAADSALTGHDPGDQRMLAEYERLRHADILSRTLAVDLLNRSLISGFIPLHLARGAGLHLLAAVPWLRRLIMQEGMQPSQELPRSMRPPLSDEPGARGI